MDQLVQPDAVLDGQRLQQAIADVERVDFRACRLSPKDRSCWAAGQEVEEAEDDDGHSNQHRQRVEDSPYQVSNHRVYTRPGP